MKLIALLALLVAGVVWGALPICGPAVADGGRERGFRNGLGKAWGLASQWQLQRPPVGGGDPTRRFGHRRRRGAGALDCDSPARRTANAVRMLRREIVFPGFPSSGDYSAAPARGLGDVCRRQERFVVAARQRPRPLSPALAGRESMAVNSEMVAAVSPQGEISIAPALRVLPSGQYALRVSADA